MTATILSEALFTAGRRWPRLPLAFLRAMPLPMLHTLRGPGLRATLRRAGRAPYYREALAARGIDLARVRGLRDLGDFFLTPDVLKQRPESLVCGTPDLAIESSGTSGHVTRVFLSRTELEYAARQGNLLLAANGIGVPAHAWSWLTRGSDTPACRNAHWVSPEQSHAFGPVPPHR